MSKDGRSESERPQKCEQCGPVCSVQPVKTAPGKFCFPGVPADGLIQRCGAVVQKRTPEPQPPQGGRSDFVRLSGALLDAVAGAYVMKQEI